MAFNPDTHHRRSIRLRGYDYSQPGAYFITVCTWQRNHLFGEVIDGEMVLNDLGKIVLEEWLAGCWIRPSITLGEFVVMPNHFHGIAIIGPGDHPRFPEIGMNPVGATCGRPFETGYPFETGRPPGDGSKHRQGDRRSPLRGPKPASVSALMSGFKSVVTRRINQHIGTTGFPVWQRNYWERLIRDEDEFFVLSEYIRQNPSQWQLDSLYSVT